MSEHFNDLDYINPSDGSVTRLMRFAKDRAHGYLFLDGRPNGGKQGIALAGEYWLADEQWHNAVSGDTIDANDLIEVE